MIAVRKLIAVIAVLLIGFIYRETSAQSYASRAINYKVTSSPTQYGAIQGTQLFSSSDETVKSFPLPFDFIYDSVVFKAGTLAWVSSNGFIRLGGTSSPGALCCDDNVGSTTSSKTNLILPFSEDLFEVTALWKVEGVTPNRILTIDWQNAKHFNAEEDDPPPFSFEVKLHELSNTIEFLYQNSASLGTIDEFDFPGVGLNGNVVANFLRVTEKSNVTPSSNFLLTPGFGIYLPTVADSVSLNFGTASPGEKVTRCFTVKHNSTASSVPLYIQNVIANSPEFQVVPGYKALLQAGESATICIEYTPYNPGPRGAELNVITNSSGDNPVVIPLKAFGSVPFAEVGATDLFRKTRTRLSSYREQALVVKSTGIGPLVVSNVKIEGRYAPNYTITHVPPASGIPSGTSDSIVVRYAPQSEGLRQASISFQTNALNYPVGTGSLNGTGVLPRLVITPNNMNFDSLDVGKTYCRIYTLSNPGSDTVIIRKNTLTSKDFDFTLEGITGNDSIIPPDKSRQVTICFTPVRSGTRVADLRIQTDIPPTLEATPRDTSEFFFKIVGTGVPSGRLFVGGTDILDTTLPNIEICRKDTLYNRGENDLVINGITFSGANAVEYNVQGITFPLTLKHGASYVFTVCSTPAQEGLRTANLVVTGTTNESTINLTLPVSTYAAKLCAAATPLSLFNVPVPVGKSDTAIVTVTNCGEVGNIFSATINGNEYKVDGISVSPEVSPSGNVQFKIIYTPTDCGSRNASFTLNGSKGSQVIPVTLNGSGVGTTFGTVIPLMTSPVGQGTEYSITVTNTSAFSWTPGTATVTGPFTVTQEVTPSTLAANQSGTLKVRFTPTNSGQNNAGSLSFVSGLPKECTVTTISLNGEGAVSGVRPEAASRGYRLEQNYPNPFNPVTEIRYSVPEASTVSLRVLDLTGRVVATLQEGRVGKGEHKVTFKADHLPSGTYLYELRSGDVRLTRELVLTK